MVGMRLTDNVTHCHTQKCYTQIGRWHYEQRREVRTNTQRGYDRTRQEKRIQGIRDVMGVRQTSKMEKDNLQNKTQA